MPSYALLNVGHSKSADRYGFPPSLQSSGAEGSLFSDGFITISFFSSDLITSQRFFDVAEVLFLNLSKKDIRFPLSFMFFLYPRKMPIPVFVDRTIPLKAEQRREREVTDGLSCMLYQNSVAMIDLVLNDLRRPAGIGFDSCLHVDGLVLYLDGLIASALAGISEEGQTALLGIVCAVLF